MARILTGKTILRGDENWKYGKGSCNELALLPDGVGYTDGTELTALQADGEVIYSRTFPSRLSSPASAPDGTLYVNDRKHLHAVAPDGTTRWSKAIESNVDPASGQGGEVYVVDDRGRLKGLNAEGEPIFQRPLKHFWQKGSYVEPRVSPEGNILAADRDRKVRAYTPDGQELWSYKLPSGLVHGPVWGPDGGAALTTLDNEIVRLDPQGQETLRLKMEGELTCDPLFHPDGSLTVGDYFGTLWRVQGEKVKAIGHFQGAPSQQSIGPDGALTITTRWGGVHVLSDPRWQQELDGIVGHTITSADGILYVNCQDGGLNALRGHRDPEAARAEEKRKALETFNAAQEPTDLSGIQEQDGYVVVGGIRVRKQG